MRHPLINAHAAGRVACLSLWMGLGVPALAATYGDLVNAVNCPPGQTCAPTSAPNLNLPGQGATAPAPGAGGSSSGPAASVGYPLLNPNGPRSAVPITPATVVDPAFYMATYADLMAAFRGNADQARNHWLQYGIREGRQSAPNFYIAAYLARYDDLKLAFGNNYEAALRHWIDNGSREGRDASPGGRFPMGAIIRLPDNGATYVVDATGAKRWITSPQVFDGCGLRWNLSQDLRRAVIDAIPNGANLNTVAECQAALRPPVPAGYVMRHSTNGAMFVIDAAGSRRAIPNEQVLTGCGLSMGQARNVFSLVVDRMPAGAPLQSPAECRSVVAGGSPPPPTGPGPGIAPPAGNTAESVAQAFRLLTWEQIQFVIDRDPGMKQAYDQAGPMLQGMMRQNPAGFPWDQVTRNRDQATLDRIAGLIAQAAAPGLAQALASLTWPQFQKVGQAEQAAVGDLYRPNPAALQPYYQNNQQGWINVLQKYTAPQFIALRGLIDRARAGTL